MRASFQTRPLVQCAVVKDIALSPRLLNAPPIVHEVLHSPGHPLDTDTRAHMESRFGHDLSQVRVHTDEKAAKSARAVNAQAYTMGCNVVFGAGQYTPGTVASEQLLAHELTHVIQQRERPVSMIGGLAIGQTYEHKADRIVETVVGGQAVSKTSSPGTEVQVQRQHTACFETAVEEFRRAPMCTPSTRIVGPGEDVKKVCGVFPGGSADCEVNEETGEITGKVKMEVSETNPCVRPCVELHERVHIRQLHSLCPALRACYQASDTGQRPATDCYKMAMRGAQEECEAYSVSVICLEERLATAPECAHPANFEYAWDVLEGEKCYLQYNCEQAAVSKTRRGSTARPASAVSRPSR